MRKRGKYKEMEKKKQFASYLSQEIYDLAVFLAEREEITRVVFVRRAVRYFMDGDHTVAARLRITKRSDPEYIKRGRLFSVYMDEEQMKQLKQVAEEQKCTLSQVFFQVILNYCAMLISLDDTGLVWKGDD